ncbi:MAG TPA: hypothetical protein VK447_12845, partial [Myxococcaceae bacterium]|nr:hypothetical protein [Myxococcaceae bacterium]
CLDLQASTLFRHPKNPDKILKVEKIVLDRKKMKGAPQLFRIDNDPTSYVLNFPLAKELSHMEPSNIIWAELPFTEDV